MTTTLSAVRTAAPGLPSNEFEVEYIAEDGTRTGLPHQQPRVSPGLASCHRERRRASGQAALARCRRHPARRDGAVLWALLLLPWVVALILVRSRHHHLDVGAITIVFAVSLGLPTLWATWAALRVAQRDTAKAAGPGLTEIAGRLAGRLRSQWEREAEARGLNDPYPLPVAWTAADAPLAGDLDALKTLAASGAGWSVSAREQWARGPETWPGWEAS